MFNGKTHDFNGPLSIAMLVITRGYTSIFLWFFHGFPMGFTMVFLQSPRSSSLCDSLVAFSSASPRLCWFWWPGGIFPLVRSHFHDFWWCLMMFELIMMILMILMIFHDFSWFLMIVHDFWWFLMIFDDVWWFSNFFWWLCMIIDDVWLCLKSFDDC